MATILLVDDDHLLRKMLRVTLQQLGHIVIEAANGREPLAKPELPTVDLVLTDIVMPEKEGIETLREIRQKHPHVRTIAMSGGGSVPAAVYLRIAQNLGAVELLSKPFSRDELALAIARAMPAGAGEPGA